MEALESGAAEAHVVRGPPGAEGLGRAGNAGTYIKPMLAQAAWSAIRLNSQEPVGATSAGTCAGHAEHQVEHAPDQHAETRPGDDVQWEVRAEVQAR